ncbi:MAG: folylpolyglutamate synthase/dihydrofolate synthase family protein [Anaerolineales bacterium]|jgi:dihydrofolate synthase/folylpolyglutamate synthase
MSIETYEDAIAYIYSYADYSVERSYRYSAELFELQRVRDLLALLGNPQDQYKTYHIAGTKGKGSVSALISSALRAADYKVGLYTSPHLLRFNERIQVNGQEVSDDEIVDLVNRVRPSVEATEGLTVYEIVTAMGFLHFADCGVEYAAIEVGLGGRLDATNVITPLVSVITSISYDHMHLLGDSLSDIAREKAGIVKEGVPVVVAPQQYEAERVIERIAEKRKAPLVRVGRDWLFSPGSHSLEGQSLYIWSSEEQPLMDDYVESIGSEEWAPPRYEIPLLGYHQVINAAVAYAALQSGRSNGIKLAERQIKQGFKNVDWPGRFQILSRKPLVIVDSAHNRDSALKLRLALEDYFPGQPVTMIFGASADKDIAGMLAELLPRVSRIVATQADHPRAEQPEFIAELAHSHGFQVEVIQPMDEALLWAIQQARPGEVILAAGSLFIAAEAIAAWERIKADVLANMENGV